jgi:surface antigen
MRARGRSGRTLLLLGSILTVTLPFSTVSAASKTPNRTHHTATGGHSAGHASTATRGHSGRRGAYAKHGSKGRYAASYGGLQCVPFARNASGIELVGNAWTWWNEAAGVYERGSAPEPGSVLAFRSNGAMRLGHVAVVSRVVNPREIEIDHANWGGYRGSVARGISVVDVSPDNDWTAVRVGLGKGDDFGSIYPTYGFIYGRPDRGTMVAAKSAPAPKPDLGPAPRDLRPASEQADGGYEEVAEAPAPRPHRKAVRRRH